MGRFSLPPDIGSRSVTYKPPAMSIKTASSSWTLRDPSHDGPFSRLYLRVPLRHCLPSERHRIFLNAIPYLTTR
jgi:hypothetical protein